MYYSLKELLRGIHYFHRGIQTLKQIPRKGEQSPALYWSQGFCSQSSDMIIYYLSRETVLYFFVICCIICCLCNKWSSCYRKLFSFEHPNTFPRASTGLP